MPLPELVPPVIPTGSSEQVTDAQLSRYAELIYKRTGIRVSPQKKTLLSNRLRRRLRDTGIANFEDYYNHLKRLPPKDAEWDAFLQEITTHETYLFRDEAQWSWICTSYLPDVASASAQSTTKSLRVWSAACSTGDEVYTMACCVGAALPNYQRWKVQILGTDIGVGAIQQAKQAVFGERAMRLVKPEYRRRFFDKAKDGELWKAKPALTQMVSFRQHNLMDRLPDRPFDLVFLKNVLIYFDGASKRQVVSNVLSMIKPGGILIAGAAEGVADLLKGLKRIQPWLYRQP
jgi:chemotaxis protein methyltransferase CheR